MFRRGCHKFLFYCPFFLVANSLCLAHDFGISHNTNAIQSIATEICPFAAALSVITNLFGSKGSQNNSIDIWPALSDLTQFGSVDNTFYSAINQNQIEELKDFYYRLNSFEQQCAPFYVNSYGDLYVRSSEEIIKNFCAISSEYMCCANWYSDEASLKTLSHLEDSIKNSHAFRKKKIKPLEKKFKKNGYIDEIITDYRNELNVKIAKKHQRLEQERKVKESFDKKQEWAARQIKDGDAEESSNLEDRLEEIQNYKEIFESCYDINENNNFAERNKLAALGLKQVEFCKHELIFGRKKHFSTYKRRLQAIVRSIQNAGQIEHRTYEISSELKAQAACLGMQLDALGIASANAIQHDIYQEAIDILNNSADVRYAFFDVETIVSMADFVSESSYAAHEYAQLHAYEQSYRLLDFASSVYDVLKGTGKFLYLSGKGVAAGCCRVGTFPFVLAKNLLTAPVDTVTEIVNGISTIAGCLLRGMWESVILSENEFVQSKTAETIQVISAHLNSMSYEEKVEEGAALVTELLFPVAMSKLKLVERSKRFANSLRKVLKCEKTVVKALEAEKAGPLLRKAGGPLMEAVEHVKEGIVWKSVIPTQPCYKGTVIPKSFEIVVGENRFWVHGNATKHMYEHLIRKGSSLLENQLLLSDFKNTLEIIVKNKVLYETEYIIGKWNIMFAPPRSEGLLPVIKHAVFMGW